MTFKIPNEADAWDANQSEPDSVDFDILSAAAAGTGVISGCTVTAQGSPNMTVAVAAGVAQFDKMPVPVTAANVTIAAASVSPRFDLIVVNSAGTLSAVTGAFMTNPTYPPVPANSVALAVVDVQPSTTVITANNINDRRVLVAEKAGNGSGSLLASLPYFMAAITDYNDYTDPVYCVIGLGSSVGAGATLPDIPNQAPSAYLKARLAEKVNKLGNATINHFNGSNASGHAFSDAQADYVTAKASATGAPILVPIAFGMNDGTSPSYHSGQTYPSVRTYIRQVTADIRKDHADPLLFTSPHPHTGRQTWGMGGNTVTYPASNQQIPDSTTGQSVVAITLPSGRTINVSYRHLRVNDLIRRTGAELGVTVIDAERFWFEAVADRGEDALFDVGEYVHPNLLGHQLSYWAAINHWVRGFETATVVNTTAPTSQVVYDEQFNIQIAGPMHLTVADTDHGILLIRAAHGGVAARHAEAYLYLGDYNGGTGSGVRIVAMGQLTGNVVTVSASGWDIVITPNFDGATIAYTFVRGYPLP